MVKKSSILSYFGAAAAKKPTAKPKARTTPSKSTSAKVNIERRERQSNESTNSARIDLVDDSTPQLKSNNALNGFAIGTTGVLNHFQTRKSFTDSILSNGGLYDAKINCNTSFIVCGSSINGQSIKESKKYRQAGKLGIPRITEEQFHSILQEKNTVSRVIKGLPPLQNGKKRANTSSTTNPVKTPPVKRARVEEAIDLEDSSDSDDDFKKFYKNGKKPLTTSVKKVQRKPVTTTKTAAPTKTVKTVQKRKTPAKKAPMHEVVFTPKPKTTKKESPKKKTPAKKAGGGGGYNRFVPADEPEKHGERQMPIGTPTTFKGKSFVVTGQMEYFLRDEIKAAIIDNGGLVRTSVSGVTSYLVIGVRLATGLPIEEGSKYKKAEEVAETNRKKRKPMIQIIKEEEFLELIRNSNLKANEERDSMPSNNRNDVSCSDILNSPEEEEEPMNITEQRPKIVRPPPRAKPSNPFDLNAIEAASKPKTVVAPSKPTIQKVQPRTAKTTKPVESKLWVDKYKPHQIQHLVGNKSLIERLVGWLKHWKNKTRTELESEGIHLSALISGAPGIGKSSAVALIGKEMGFEIYELNASDARSKRALTEKLEEAVNCHVFSFSKAQSKKDGVKRLVIMDEVDGMSSGDRGGMQALIAKIKKTEVPIVCICNERNSKKVESLSKQCLDLQFKAPTFNELKGRLEAICNKEKLEIKIDFNAELNLSRDMRHPLNMLWCASKGDIRQIINTLQMWKQNSDVIDTVSVFKRSGEMEKDSEVQRVSSTHAAQRLFCSNGSLANHLYRHRMYFSNYSEVPLYVHEYYPKALNRPPYNNNKYNCPSKRIIPKELQCDFSHSAEPENPFNDSDIERLARAADDVSDMDLITNRIRSGMDWSMLRTEATFAMSAGFRALIKGNQPFVQSFSPVPENWSKASRNKGNKLKLREVRLKISTTTHSSPTDIRLYYHYPLMKHCALPLKYNPNKQGAQQVVDRLIEYGLTRDDLIDILPALCMKDRPFNPLQGVPGSVKGALTRCYNATHEKLQSGLAASQGRGKTAADDKLITKGKVTKKKTTRKRKK